VHGLSQDVGVIECDWSADVSLFEPLLHAMLRGSVDGTINFLYSVVNSC